MLLRLTADQGAVSGHRYYNHTGKIHGGKSAAGENDDKTRREWKGPVVWQPPADNEPGKSQSDLKVSFGTRIHRTSLCVRVFLSVPLSGATARRRSTIPGSARARWGVEKRLVNQQLVIKA